MTEEMDLWSTSVALSHSFLRLYCSRGFGSIPIASTSLSLTHLSPIANDFCRGHTETFPNVVLRHLFTEK